MRRRSKYVMDRASLDHFARIHDREILRHARHHTEIMGDQKQRQPQLLLQFLQQAQDLCLHRNVEGRRGFVGDQQFRIAHQCHGDHDPLTQAAGELVGILAKPHSRRGDAYAFQQLSRSIHGLSTFGAPMPFKHLRHLRPDRIGRIQTRHRFLENHRILSPRSRAI